MLGEILAHIKNWFIADWRCGHYVISGGKINLPFVAAGQYFRVVGSVFNDGVYKYADDLKLTDEEFDGEIWALAIPPALLKLTQEIEEWQAENGTAAASPFVSESFGGYSYSKASGQNRFAAQSGGSGSVSWISTFAARLNRWRKI